MAFSPLKSQDLVWFNFDTSEQIEAFVIVNDGVMGGRSQSEVQATNAGTMIFQGNVSLENNGGFASTRALMPERDLSGYAGIRFRLKGDGKTYSLRVRSSAYFDGLAYRYDVYLPADEWKEVLVPFEKFTPTFRGRMMSQMPDLDPNSIRQVGFLIAAKQAGAFQLEVDEISAYADGSAPKD
ncbi:CIA30 family protein [Pontibacter sp. G13]|uniref:CIA30 family protein n=1 Tax=Pontibacter sp. G13 TaxID=3074898 RepID=UPI0028890654|nr:CIA30 family protein [Pontibacter sp. G13]WNJ19154.1 CIA30 family protein [Pontibacter sp. G13]